MGQGSSESVDTGYSGIWENLQTNVDTSVHVGSEPWMAHDQCHYETNQTTEVGVEPISNWLVSRVSGNWTCCIYVFL